MQNPIYPGSHIMQYSWDSKELLYRRENEYGVESFTPLSRNWPLVMSVKFITQLINRSSKEHILSLQVCSGCDEKAQCD